MSEDFWFGIAGGIMITTLIVILVFACFYPSLFIGT